MFQQNDSDLQVHGRLTALFTRRLESTQWITSDYEDYITAHWITFWAKWVCSLQRAQPQASKSTCHSGSKKRHVLRRKSDSAFASFDKLCDCGHRMQRSKAVLCNCHRWQWQEDDRIKTHQNITASLKAMPSALHALKLSVTLGASTAMCENSFSALWKHFQGEQVGNGPFT